MNERKAEKARQLTSNWGQGYWDRAVMTEDYVMEQHGGTMQGVYPGERGALDYAEGFRDAWVEATVGLDELFEHDGLIVMLTRLRVRGRSSGIEVEIAGAGIVRFAADGRAERVDAYTDRDEAMESVGLASR